MNTRKDMKNLLLSLIFLLYFATTSAEAHSHKNKKLSSFLLLAPSRCSLVEQNLWIKQMALERIRDEQRMAELVDLGVLEALPISTTLVINPTLPQNRRYALPFVNDFLRLLSGEFYAQFGKPLQVNSAVRPMTVQKKLRRINRSAAPVDGETASSHEAGTTVDIERR